MFTCNTRPLDWALQAVSEPSLTLLVCHLTGEQMPKVSEDFMEEYIYI